MCGKSEVEWVTEPEPPTVTTLRPEEEDNESMNQTPDSGWRMLEKDTQIRMMGEMVRLGDKASFIYIFPTS